MKSKISIDQVFPLYCRESVNWTQIKNIPIECHVLRFLAFLNDAYKVMYDNYINECIIYVII